MIKTKRIIYTKKVDIGTPDNPAHSFYDVSFTCADKDLDGYVTDAKALAYDGKVTVEAIPDPPPTEEEIMRQKIDQTAANVDYMSMMTGVDLPTGEEVIPDAL